MQVHAGDPSQGQPGLCITQSAIALLRGSEPPTDVRRNYAFTSMREQVLLPAALLTGAPLRAATAAASLLSSFWA
jgi:hypothetical protein